MSDAPQPGDIYDARSGKYFCVVKSEPYASGFVLAEFHDGKDIHPTVIDPANPSYIKRPKRPPFPKRDYRIGLDATGGVGYPTDIVHIPADEVDGLPWRWADGTLLTDKERGLVGTQPVCDHCGKPVVKGGMYWRHSATNRYACELGEVEAEVTGSALVDP